MPHAASHPRSCSCRLRSELLSGGSVGFGGVPLVATIVLAIWSNNKRINDLRAYMTGEIASLREFIRSEIRRLEGRIGRGEHPIAKA